MSYLKKIKELHQSPLSLLNLQRPNDAKCKGQCEGRMSTMEMVYVFMQTILADVHESIDHMNYYSPNFVTWYFLPSISISMPRINACAFCVCVWGGGGWRDAFVVSVSTAIKARGTRSYGPYI